jgi:DNA polymerase III gamma/tau subunit
MNNLLITGAHHDERMKYATSLAMNLLCQFASGCGNCFGCLRVISHTHPNLVIIEPEDSDTNDIKIEAVRRLIEESHKTNFEAGKAIFIITHMHQITKAAANALLKSLEESRESKIFLALAPSKTAVLATIASRLISVIIKPTPTSDEYYDEKIVEKIYSITTTSPSLRYSFCEQFPSTRPELIQNFQNLLETCHELLRAYYKQNTSLHTQALEPLVSLKLSEALHQAVNMLNKNANPRLITENLLLSEWPYACL